MRILLLAMPDAAGNFHRIIKVPNLGLCSIAANLDSHDVRVADLVLVHKNIRTYLQALLGEFRPQLIGISSMSFQYRSATEVVAICRAAVPEARIVIGGYHATLAFEEIAKGKAPFDFLIRGEGEKAFPALVDALEGRTGFAEVPGLSWVSGGSFVHNARGEVLDLRTLPKPDRSVRLVAGFNYFGRKLDCIETSRGCTMPCTFCSINGMYGTIFRSYEIDRVIEDLRELRRLGTETVLIVDDNVTLQPGRFTRLCKAIARNGLDCMEYLVQSSVAGIIADPELIPAMARANFSLVFLGIESVNDRNMQFFQKEHIREKTEKAVKLLRKHKIAVMGGFIIGNPHDTKEDIKEIFRAAKKLKVDLPYIQCITPYPGTGIRQELLNAGLVVNADDLSRYTGFICNVRTHNLTLRQLNRIMNWENIKIFLSPAMFRNNYFTQKREKAALKVLLNNIESVRGVFTGDQFRSRHTF